MIATADLTALHARLDEVPDDWQARLVLSDLLEELGRDTEAGFQRELVRRRTRPDHYHIHGTTKRVWTWWVANPPLDIGCLPHATWEAIGRKLWYPTFCDRPTRQLAEEVLMEVWREGHWNEELRWSVTRK